MQPLDGLALRRCFDCASHTPCRAICTRMQLPAVGVHFRAVLRWVIHVQCPAGLRFYVKMGMGSSGWQLVISMRAMGVTHGHQPGLP